MAAVSRPKVFSSLFVSDLVAGVAVKGLNGCG